MTDEILEFLLEPKWLRLAVELAPKMEEVKEHVLEEYWKNVRARLDSYLPDTIRDWRVFGPIGVGSRRSVGIASRVDLAGGDERRELSGYSVIYESLENTPYLGVKRGAPIGSHAGLQAYEGEIAARLVQQHLKRREANWPGWEHITELGLPAIAPGDLEFLVRLNDDNRDTGHPLADHAARLLWDVFSSNRELLEKASGELRSISAQ